MTPPKLLMLDERSIDKRVVRRNLDRGRVDPVAYKSLLEALPDLSGNVDRFDAAAQPQPQVQQ